MSTGNSNAKPQGQIRWLRAPQQPVVSRAYGEQDAKSFTVAINQGDAETIAAVGECADQIARFMPVNTRSRDATRCMRPWTP